MQGSPFAERAAIERPCAEDKRAGPIGKAARRTAVRGARLKQAGVRTGLPHGASPRVIAGGHAYELAQSDPEGAAYQVARLIRRKVNRPGGTEEETQAVEFERQRDSIAPGIPAYAACRLRSVATRRPTPRSQSGNRSTYCSSRWMERGTRQVSNRTGTTKISSSGRWRAHSSA